MQTYLDQPNSLTRDRLLGEATPSADRVSIRLRRPVLRWSLILPMIALLVFWAVLLTVR